MEITKDILIKIMPNSAKKYNGSTASLAETYAPYLTKSCNEYGITTELRLAYFLATIAVESGELRYTEEIASGKEYDTGKKALALGNTPQADGDGQLYKGRGLIQITGKNNYVAYSNAMGFDFYSSKDRVKMLIYPANAVRSACWFWKTHGLNEIADKNDGVKVRKKVNGGLNGFDAFLKYVVTAKEVLKKYLA